MAPIRTKNRFGKRFIRLRDMAAYVVDLNLSPHPPNNGFMEFLEAEGLLSPVCRIQLPPEVARRFSQDDEPSGKFTGLIERDGNRLEAARELIDTLNMNRWEDSRFFGESVHILDELQKKHSEFVQTEFSTGAFVPWKDRRIHLYDTQSGPIYSGEQDAPTLYHYWQVFWLASILRSAAHVYFPLDDEDLSIEILRNGIPDETLKRRTYKTVNVEAYGELKRLREFARHFEAVGYFKAYSHNALQVSAIAMNASGRIPHGQWLKYLKREGEIARDALAKEGLGENDMVTFIGQQCQFWHNACRVGPSAVADEYKRNIHATIDLLRSGFGIDVQKIIDQVGRRTGHFKPTLKVIFPDWAEDQRDLTIRSLKNWVEKDMAALPAPFPCSEAELEEFCSWLEDKGLYQYYWHFRRLVDLERPDDPIHRAASTSEVVGFATLCEMIANEVMLERGLTPRGNTLFPKLRRLFNSDGPTDLTLLFSRFGKLANTKTQGMPQHLSQISRIKKGGSVSPILRTMLSFMVIRNEGAHLGLLRFDHDKVVDMIRVLSLASLMIWKAREQS